MKTFKRASRKEHFHATEMEIGLIKKSMETPLPHYPYIQVTFIPNGSKTDPKYNVAQRLVP